MSKKVIGIAVYHFRAASSYKRCVQ